MSVGRLDPEFDPRLVEAAVLAATRRPPVHGDFHAERDTIYPVAEPERREAAFQALHACWFTRLGLDRPFRGALAEQPAIAAGCARWLVAQARGRREEAADLLIAPDVGPTLLVRVTPETVTAPEMLWRLLRRELLHVADMLDPAFGYEAALPPGAAGPGRAGGIRESYRVLWNAWVDGRLVRRGALPATARGERLADFLRAFPHLGAGAEAAFDRVFDGARLTHAALMAVAAGEPVGAPTTAGR